MNGHYFETFSPDGGGVVIYSAVDGRNVTYFSHIKDQNIFFEELKKN